MEKLKLPRKLKKKLKKMCGYPKPFRTKDLRIIQYPLLTGGIKGTGYLHPNRDRRFNKYGKLKPTKNNP